MKKVHLTILAALSLFLFSGHAVAAIITLDFNDTYYLGSISNPTPASPAADRERVENLVGLTPGTMATILGTGGGGANTADYVRSDNFPVLPGVGADCSQGGNGNEHFAIGCDYFIQKYAGTGQNGNAYVWYIAGLGIAGMDDLETPVRDIEDFQANQWQAFGAAPTTRVPEPSIIALFAAGLFGLGFARRRNS